MTKIKPRKMNKYAVLGLALGSLAYAQDQTLSVSDPRPLYQAVRQLQRLYGWQVNYQDPPYENPSDMENSAAPPLAAGGPNVRKHISPRERAISVKYSAPKTGTAEERRGIIDGIVEAFSAAGAGQFRVYHQGAFSHVVPASVKRVSGAVEPVTSACDVTVSLPPAMRTINDTLALTLPQISQGIGASVSLGMAPMNLLLGHQYPTEAVNENACNMLSGLLEEVNLGRTAPPIHDAWVMLYDIVGRIYYFSVVPAPTPQPAPNPRLGPYVPQHVDK
jgi:hypothetical protein